MSAVVICTFNLALLIGTAYLLGWQDWSPWWFLAAACFVMWEEKK
jgi:hypothetical protein